MLARNLFNIKQQLLHLMPVLSACCGAHPHGPVQLSADPRATLQAAKEKSSALLAPETEESEETPAPSSAPGSRAPEILPADIAAPADVPVTAAPSPGAATTLDCPPCVLLT